MDETKNKCNMLMEEYELLKSRLEALDLSPNIKIDQLADFGITEADLVRLRELEKEIEKNCSDQFPKFDKVDFGPGIDNGLFPEERQ